MTNKVETAAVQQTPAAGPAKVEKKTDLKKIAAIAGGVALIVIGLGGAAVGTFALLAQQPGAEGFVMTFKDLGTEGAVAGLAVGALAVAGGIVVFVVKFWYLPRKDKAAAGNTAATNSTPAATKTNVELARDFAKANAGKAEELKKAFSEAYDKVKAKVEEAELKAYKEACEKLLHLCFVEAEEDLKKDEVIKELVREGKVGFYVVAGNIANDITTLVKAAGDKADKAKEALKPVVDLYQDLAKVLNKTLEERITALKIDQSDADKIKAATIKVAEKVALPA